jgi:purine-binding chemotaxis protein CheW
MGTVTTAPVPVLLLRVAGRRAAVPLGDVVEVMRPLPTEGIPGAPRFLRGLAMIRGAPVPVLDLRVLLGSEETSAPPARFVTVRAGERRIALAADGVEGTREVDPGTLAGLPPLLRGAAADVVTSVGSLDRELLVLLQGSRRLLDEVDQALAGEDR